MQERHPRATAVVAPATLTDAAGRPLAAVAAWEMAP
jgi:hypothetical protein